ncbi:hypothetical protein SmJEL517_g00338 [Synchytrium microbalum]|uniref:RING-CH-type domain-containing protein n=1 Tax=Synchytrium microbalum TaxID=1806994 RepID=A0A507CJY8_9FUNG|nr:uncharacterized protein SmJEL517_g00338 [Synchytrium microbalum]TPX38103.1 hypothetical protein SmJEL517_g00338 [Synchytrium microbalum]
MGSKTPFFYTESESESEEDATATRATKRDLLKEALLPIASTQQLSDSTIDTILRLITEQTPASVAQTSEVPTPNSITTPAIVDEEKETGELAYITRQFLDTDAESQSTTPNRIRNVSHRPHHKRSYSNPELYMLSSLSNTPMPHGQLPSLYSAQSSISSIRTSTRNLLTPQQFAYKTKLAGKTHVEDRFSRSRSENVSNSSMFGGSTTSQQVPTCRICLGDDRPQNLFRPCRCDGSQRLVHLDCLNRWRRMSPTPLSRFQCDICKSYYKFKGGTGEKLFGEKVTLIVNITALFSSFIPFPAVPPTVIIPPGVITRRLREHLIPCLFFLRGYKPVSDSLFTMVIILYNALSWFAQKSHPAALAVDILWFGLVIVGTIVTAIATHARVATMAPRLLGLLVDVNDEAREVIAG